MVTRIQMGPAHFQSDLDAANRGTMGQDTSAHHEPTELALDFRIP
jgi:hypothetical protein